MSGKDSPFHPDLRRRARWLPRGLANPYGLSVIRALTAAQMNRTPPGVETVRAGQIRLRVHKPAEPAPWPALLWVHGGGLVLGSPAQDDALCADLARRCGVVVAAVQYRLAPKHPYPAALDDCYRGLQWLATQSFVDTARIAIGGASAGGGLAAALAVLARDRAEIPLAFQLLSYPMLDDRTVTRDDIDERSFRMWNNRSNAYAWRSYLGCEPGEPSVPALAAPARVTDLAGLPPAWIGVGTLDLFHAEDAAYAQRLNDAGVPCDLHPVDGAFHGFDSVSPRSSVTHQFRSAQAAALSQGLTRPVQSDSGGEHGDSQ